MFVRRRWGLHTYHDTCSLPRHAVGHNSVGNCRAILQQHRATTIASGVATVHKHAATGDICGVGATKPAVQAGSCDTAACLSAAVAYVRAERRDVGTRVADTPCSVHAING